MTEETIKALIDELEIAKGKICLAAYHSGQQVDVSWIDHRISTLKKEQ